MSKIEKLIRDGQLSLARSQLALIQTHKLSKAELVKVAELGRRVQDYLFSLRVLNKTIEDHREGLVGATSEAIEEYVRNLIKLGFYRESQGWIKDLQKTKSLASLDLKARLKMAQWDYVGAAYFMKSYVRRVDPNQYEFQVGLLNYCASLVASSQYSRAMESLDQLRSLSWNSRNRLIYANCNELLAQVYLGEEEFDQAIKCIDRAQRHIPDGSGGIWSFYGRKWRAIINLKKGGPDKDVMDEIRSLNIEAQKWGYFEDLRELQRVVAISEKDPHLLFDLYFKTQNRFYRKKLLDSIPWCSSIPDEYQIQIGEGDVHGWMGSIDQLGVGSDKCNRLIYALFADCYRPLSIGEVFDSVYPNELFLPFHSQAKLYNVVTRLRKLISQKAPLHVDWSNEGVRWTSQKRVYVKVPRRLIPPSQKTDFHRKLKSAFKGTRFSSQDVASKLQLSPRTAQRRLSEALKNKQVRSEGTGRVLKYRLCS